ncbi:hypothetical protein B5E91_13310 [Thomasclavelia spiroformis]|uniref:Uncharacterized protein n=1 Tax=Thomasclavelia spiroformis TaxID=29348 RepID=A0A1Y4QBT3_9FIRM|nr:hypothetical protein [Thomasclavelia spiroformis]OUQ02714.1 hypothetical protein B5E91_13310 [Thomasclavelia spiroformis]
MKEYEEKYKQIFRYLSLGMSQNEISKLLSTSRNTIRKIKAVTDSIRLSWEDASKMTNEEFVHTIFPKNKNWYYVKKKCQLNRNFFYLTSTFEKC